MYIFIDESGPFLPNQRRDSAVSCTAAAIIPRRFYKAVEEEFVAITEGWPSEKGEVKGRLLGDDQILSIAEWLARYNVFCEVVAFDLNIFSPEELTAHKHVQAEKLTANLTDQHHPDLVRQTWEMRGFLEGLADQLYVQSVGLTEVVASTYKTSMLYFAQGMGGELSNFIWRIDAKLPDKTTPAEDVWNVLVKPALQSGSRRDPVIMLQGGEYGIYRSKFPAMRSPDYLREFYKLDVSDDGENIQAILEDLEFCDSQRLTGLKIADIIANGMRRALMGELSDGTVEVLAKLLMAKKKGASAIKIATLGESTEVPNTSPLYKTIPLVDKFARSILWNKQWLRKRS